MDATSSFSMGPDFLLHLGSSIERYGSDHVLTEGYDLLGEMERVYNGSEDLTPCVGHAEMSDISDLDDLDIDSLVFGSVFSNSNGGPVTVSIEDVMSSTISLPDNFCIGNEVNNLLDSFEEASTTAHHVAQGNVPHSLRAGSGAHGSQSLPVSRSVSAANSPEITPPSTPPPFTLQKIHSGKGSDSKHKAAILIPLAAPAQRGRGKARGGGRGKAVPHQEMTLMGGSSKLQKILSRKDSGSLGNKDVLKVSASQLPDFESVEPVLSPFDSSTSTSLVKPVTLNPDMKGQSPLAAKLGMNRVTDPCIAKAIMTKTPTALQLLSNPTPKISASVSKVGLHQSKSADCLLEHAQSAGGVSILPGSLRNSRSCVLPSLSTNTGPANILQDSRGPSSVGLSAHSKNIFNMKNETAETALLCASATTVQSSALHEDDFSVDEVCTQNSSPEMRYEFVVRLAERIEGKLGRDSVLDHDYCRDSPRRVIVDEFELILSPTKGLGRSVNKTVSEPVVLKPSSAHSLHQNPFREINTGQFKKVEGNKSSLDPSHHRSFVLKGSQKKIEEQNYNKSSTDYRVDARPTITEAISPDAADSDKFGNMEKMETNRIDQNTEAPHQPEVSLLESMKSSIGSLLCVEDGVIKLNPAIAESLASLQSKTCQSVANLSSKLDDSTSVANDFSKKLITCSSPKPHQVDNLLKNDECKPSIGHTSPSENKVTISTLEPENTKEVLDQQEFDSSEKQKLSASEKKSFLKSDGFYSPSSDVVCEDQATPQNIGTLQMEPMNMCESFHSPMDYASPSSVKSALEDPDEFHFQIGSHSDEFYDHDEFEETWNEQLQNSQNRPVSLCERTVARTKDNLAVTLPTSVISSGRVRSDGSGRSRRSRPYCKANRGQRDWKPSNSPVLEDDGGLGYNKLPSYVTDLSIPTKTGRRQLTADDVVGQAAHDCLPADHSPKRDLEDKMFDKMPAYASCFTNSTKYDGTVLSSPAAHSVESKSPVHCPSARSDPFKPYSRLSKCGSRGFRSSPSPRSYRRRRRSVSESSDSSSGSRSPRSGYRRTSPYSITYQSRSRSRSCSRSSSQGRHRSHSRERSSSSRRGKSRKSDCVSEDRWRKRDQRNRDKVQKMKDRKIVYVGNIPDGYKRHQLRKRFERFGEIEEVSVHFREGDHKDNYGFVTFYRTEDAYAAIDKGNSNTDDIHFDLSFGGRRQFCSDHYADLDGNLVIEEEYAAVTSRAPVDFDTLLKQAMRAKTSSR